MPNYFTFTCLSPITNEGSTIVANFTYIRDQIIINDVLKAQIDAQKLPTGSTIRLVGQQIQHAPGFALLMPGYHMVIVAGEYDNNGGIIDVSSASPGTPGAPGRAGRPGRVAGNDIPPTVGETGSQGGRGGQGANATSVRIICELFRGGEIRLFANGAVGGRGGEGGKGGKGGDGKKTVRHGEQDIVDGATGGNGGSGGTGGAGGAGGQVLVARISQLFFAAPVLQAAGGPGGPGGSGGHRGANGKFSEPVNGSTGPVGAPGPPGAAGSVTNSKVTADDYWSRVLAELGPIAAEWAEYRLAVGEYHYRAYNSEDPARAGFLIRAMQEFDAVLRLNPANAQAIQLQRQILLNQNILGLPRELDLIPDFERYIAAFQGFGSLLFGTFGNNIQVMLAAENLDGIRGLLVLQQQSIEGAVADTQEELQTAVSALKDAQDEVKAAQARVVEVNRQIQAAMDEMKNQSISIGEIVGIVSEIGGAVAAVAAAIPTAGASLVALVPDVIALSKSVIDNAGPILDALFNEELPDVDNVTNAYKKVNQDVNKAIDGFEKGKTALINFVNLVHKLAAGTTPDNAKSVALVQRGVELIHAQLLAQHRNAQADHSVKAVGAKLARANALLAKTQDLQGDLSGDARVLREAGLSGVRNAQLHLDSLLGFAFRAQRSVEIYTLKSEVQNLFLDAGYVHPDIERDFAENHSDAKLIAAYTQSWARLLQPVKMEADYLSFFSGNNLDDDSRRLSFTNPDLLQSFRDTHDLQFTVDVRDLPATHFDAKVQGVFVAFVGATSPSRVISCELRHAERYEQKQPNGNVVVQLLQSHTDTQQARTSRLELAGVNFGSAPPLTAPQSLSFWGRGVAGRWGLSIPQSEFDLDPPDLTDLSEIQVWVGYQFLR